MPLILIPSAYFAQHHVDQLVTTMSPVAFLASKYPGKSELEYRSHLGAFGITGLTGLASFVDIPASSAKTSG
jgi:ATPase subunit of ABC transporter with duplicated ATPase domains